MSIPKFHDLFTEVLEVLSDGRTLHRRELIASALGMLTLTEDERSATFPRGGNIIENRIHWTIEFLYQAGAITRPSRGFAAITDLGRQLLKEGSPKVTLEQLKKTDGMKAWDERSKAKARQRNKTEDGPESEGETEGVTPEERIARAISEIEELVAADLLQRIKRESPVFMERTVLSLLHRMGYGSSEDDLEHLGGSGDGGVDGVINQDALGLDQIYVQAKRYSDGVIDRAQVQAFVGALAGKHASRGVFLTTSTFAKVAREYVANLKDTRVILIDGDDLAEMMIRYKVGVTVARMVEVPAIDENFFEA